MADDQFVVARAAMVERLDRPSLGDRVRRALLAVSREDYVPRFFTFPTDADSAAAQPREWRTETDDDAASVVYDEHRALGVARDEAGRTTSTISAPDLVASMLDLLDLQPGMRVVEIGTGTGYNAALLAEIVGSDGHVCTIDIDEALVDAAGERLAVAGYSNAHTIAADGAGTLPEHGPFDRLIATVGCADLAPAWFEQLAVDGFALVPIQHGGVHPLMRAERQGNEITSTAVGASGFVAIQGHQASARSPWPFTRQQLGDATEMTADALPADLADTFRVERREGLGSPASWDVSFYLSLVERRTAWMVRLGDADRCGASVDAAASRILRWGAHGEELARDLVDHIRRWLALGSPPARRYTSSWYPRGSAPTSDEATAWRIDRVDHAQVVTLP